MAARTKPVLVADLVARFLSKRHGHPQRAREATTLKVFGAFQRIGPPVTEHVEPAFFRQGVLTLTVAESTWLTELTFLKPQILERLNRALGREVVSDLRMRLGNLRRRAVARDAPMPKLSAEEREKIEAWGEMIPNAAVREAMMKAAARTIGAKPAKVEAEAKAKKEEAKRAPHRDRWKEKRGKRRE